MAPTEPAFTARRVRFYPVQLTLSATSALTLHAHQAAILYALLSRANGLGTNTSAAMPDGVLLDAPEQSRTSLGPGEKFNFGITTLASSGGAARERLDVLLRGLKQIAESRRPARKGLSGNFEIDSVTPLVHPNQSGAALDDRALQPIPDEAIAAEAARIAGMREVTLRFHAPLRCERPKNLRSSGATCLDETLFLPEVFLRRAARRLCELGLLEQTPDVARQAELLDNRLVWLDISYGPRQTRKALGGAVGRVVLRLHAPQQLAETLALAQYARVGEKTRWGFGAFRVEELGPNPYACRRSSGLLELALGAPAVDHVADAHQLASGRMAQIVREVLSGGYAPSPARRFLLADEDPQREPRLLCVPSREDRALQSAVLKLIAPALDLFFEESSLAYRRGLGRQRAAQRLKDAYRDGFCWAIKSDFHRFFDSIDHALLEERLDAYLNDDRLVALIMRWVAAAAAWPGRGVPTGSPLSPLLANLFLDRFDEQIEAEGGRLVRYADDFLLLYKAPEDAQRLLAAARHAARQLKLHLNDEKTATLDLAEPFRFLGFRFQKRDRWELADDGKVKHLDDLGWKDAPAAEDSLPAWPELRGEVAAAGSARQSLLIVGPGVTWIGVKDRRLICRRRGEPEQHIALHRVDDLLVLGPATLDASLFSARQRDPLGVWLADSSGGLKSVLLSGRALDNAELLRCQVAAANDATRSLEIARAVVVAKLNNYAALADCASERGRPSKAGRQLRGLVIKAREAATLDELIGVEGAGAAAWYGSLAARLHSGFSFARRVAPDARDPINALLNLGFSFLYRHAELALLQQGLAPALGFLHQPRSGHSALASDLIEPFRHLIDRSVIVASHELRRADFVEAEGGPHRLRIAPAAVRRFLALLHESLAMHCVGREQTSPRPYRQQLTGLVRGLHRHLLNPAAKFQVFRHP